MFTIDMIVYPCEQNQNRYENGLAPLNTGKFTFQKSDWFDRVTIRDLCERSLRWISWVVEKHQFYYEIKFFWVYLRPVPGE